MLLFRNCRTLLELSVASAFGALSLASRLGAQEPAERIASDVHAHVATDRTAYRLGASIQVSLQLQNVSSHPVQFWLDVPRGSGSIAPKRQLRARSQRGLLAYPSSLRQLEMRVL